MTRRMTKDDCDAEDYWAFEPNYVIAKPAQLAIDGTYLDAAMVFLHKIKYR